MKALPKSGLALILSVGASHCLATAVDLPLPKPIAAAMAKAQVPSNAYSVLVVDAVNPALARVSHRAGVPVNPASVMKLVTTFAALDTLGPEYTWKTPVFFDGPVQDGVLLGNLWVKGVGDPKMLLEHVTALYQRVQSLGVTHIVGDIVLDRSGFDVPAPDPASFDGEPLRPYNAAPDALLLNFKSVILTFTPDPANGVALVRSEPPLAGLVMPASVPLGKGACGDYRSALAADFSNPSHFHFGGTLAASCGEKVWPVLYSDAKNYAVRVMAGMWQHVGGKLSGTVRYGKLPSDLQPTFEHASPPLADIVRDVNKFSNNVMAQQIFVRLGTDSSRVATGRTVATFGASREAVAAWWAKRWPGVAAPALENGSGLSRTERISALALAKLLQSALASPVSEAFVQSLPIAGVDGTLRNAKVQQAQGAAQMKTGSLRDVAAVAGYVTGASGKRYIVVAIVNHPQASAARPVFESLMDWVAKDAP